MSDLCQRVRTKHAKIQAVSTQPQPAYPQCEHPRKSFHCHRTLQSHLQHTSRFVDAPTPKSATRDTTFIPGRDFPRRCHGAAIACSQTRYQMSSVCQRVRTQRAKIQAQSLPQPAYLQRKHPHTSFHCANAPFSLTSNIPQGSWMLMLQSATLDTTAIPLKCRARLPRRCHTYLECAIVTHVYYSTKVQRRPCFLVRPIDFSRGWTGCVRTVW